MQTDLALEIATLCEKCQTNTNVDGLQALSSFFGVKIYSKELFLILHIIHERFDLLAEILDVIDYDEEMKDDWKNRLMQLRAVFSFPAIKGTWNHNPGTQNSKLTTDNIQTIKTLSMPVRALYPLRRLSVEELDELKAQTTEFLGWLEAHQLKDDDFIRANLISGVKSFLFRLEHFEWVGVSHSLKGLKEVIDAYLLLEKGEAVHGGSEDYSAMAKKTAAFAKRAYDGLSATKSVGEMATWLLAVYGTVDIAVDKIQGLLSN